MPALSPRLLAARLACAAGLALAAGAASAVTVEVRIAASSDDAEQMDTGQVTVSSSDLELVTDGSDVQLVGLRFPGVAIPPGALIEQAWVQFQTDEVSTGAASLAIQGETTPQAPTFTATVNGVSVRPRTVASVAWTPAPWSVVGEQDAAQRTPNLAPVLQELVNAGTWASGDPIVLIVTGSGRRTAESFDGVAAAAPLLHVEYATSGNQTPVLSITSPPEGTIVSQGTPIQFSATASDVESGDVSASISWTSNLDGVLGVGSSFSRSDLGIGAHTLTITATDGDGGVGSQIRHLNVFAPGNEVIAVGDIGTCTGTGDDATGDRLESVPGPILGLGDYAYPDSSASDFASCFEPSWGQHKARILPVAGNHEYEQPGAEPYFAYFEAALGVRPAPWYSFDVGDWHLVALDSNCDEVGGCDASSPQGQWLAADLAANSKPCTLAYFHHPRFSSGVVGVDPDPLYFWQVLYAHGADLILSGHDHAYERFARMNPSGGLEPTRGIRSFISGAGGVGLHGADEDEPNSEVRNETTFGALRLTLAPTSYAWEFIGAGPGTFTDFGSEECVYGAPVVTITSPAPNAAFAPGSSVSLAGSATDLEQGNVSGEIAWSSSRDGALGTGASLSVVLSGGSHVLTASVTDQTGLTGSAQVPVTVTMTSGSGCGLGPELAPALAALALLRRRAARRGGR
jgi:hypothetical protein